MSTEHSAQSSPEDDAAEVKLGDTARQRDANTALRALARAARSYTIYDPRNEAIAGFLSEVKRCFEVFLDSHGEMQLEVRPYELVLEQQVVYMDRDRERSLAFKLFRDGVRVVRVEPGLTWHELTQLLWVLSVRYVGIRQNPAEDDIVTLLWKAGFQHLEIRSVEGFVEDDEEDLDMPELDASMAGKVRSLEGVQRFPKDFDRPAPRFNRLEEVSYFPITGEEREEVQEALASTHMPELVLRVVDDLFVASNDKTNPFSFGDAIPFVEDTRELLLSEEHIDSLLRLVRMLWTYADTTTDRHERRRIAVLLESMLGPHGFARTLASVSKESTEPPEVWRDLLKVVPGDALELLLDQLDSQRGGAQRSYLRALIGDFLPERSGDVTQRYRERSGTVAVDLLRVLAERAPEQAREAVSELARSHDIEVQLEFLALAPELLGSRSRNLLAHMLHSSTQEVRIRTVETIVGLGEAGAFPAIEKFVTGRADAGASPEELIAGGQALATLNAAQAMTRFEKWANLGGFLSRFSSDTDPMRVVAIGGLGAIAGDASEALLRKLLKRGAPQERELAQRMLRERIRARRDAEVTA